VKLRQSWGVRGGWGTEIERGNSCVVGLGVSALCGGRGDAAWALLAIAAAAVGERAQRAVVVGDLRAAWDERKNWTGGAGGPGEAAEQGWRAVGQAVAERSGGAWCGRLREVA
jgi:hypothetical protein